MTKQTQNPTYLVDALMNVVYSGPNIQFVDDLVENKNIVVIDDVALFCCCTLEITPEGLAYARGYFAGEAENVPTQVIDFDYVRAFGLWGTPMGIIPVTERRRGEVERLGELQQKEGYQEVTVPDSKIIRVYDPVETKGLKDGRLEGLVVKCTKPFASEKLFSFVGKIS